MNQRVAILVAGSVLAVVLVGGVVVALAPQSPARAPAASYPPLTAAELARIDEGAACMRDDHGRADESLCREASQRAARR